MAYLSVYPATSLPVYLSAYLAVCLPSCLSDYLPACLCTQLPVCLPAGSLPALIERDQILQSEAISFQLDNFSLLWLVSPICFPSLIYFPYLF